MQNGSGLAVRWWPRLPAGRITPEPLPARVMHFTRSNSPAWLSGPYLSGTQSRIFILIILVLFGLQIKATLAGPFDVDEFGVLHLGRTVCEHGLTSIHPYKMLTGGLACVARALGGDDPLGILGAGRLLALGYQLVFLAGIGLLAGRAFGARVGLLALLLTLTQFHFIDQGYRFRTETLNTGLFTLAYGLLLSRRPAEELVAGLLMAAAVLVHDKSVYLLPASLFFIRLHPASLARAYGVFGLAIGAVYADQFLRFERTAVQALAARTAGETDKLPFASFYVQAVARNWVLLALAGFGLWRLTVRQASLRWLPAVAGAVAFLAVHPAPFPFFFLMAVPFFVVPAAWGAAELLDGARNGGVGAAATALLLTVLVTPAVARNQANLAVGNEFQLAVVRRAEQFLAGGVPGYFDGVGMVPSRLQSRPLWLDHNTSAGFTLADVQPFIDDLRERRTGLIIHTSFLRGIPEPFPAWLRANYVQDWGPVWVSGRTFAPSAGAAWDFTLDYPGYYEIVGVEQARVDGVPVTGCCVRLAAGPHRIEAAAAAPFSIRLRPKGWQRERGNWAPMDEDRPPFIDSWSLQWDGRSMAWFR